MLSIAIGLFTKIALIVIFFFKPDATYYQIIAFFIDSVSLQAYGI